MCFSKKRIKITLTFFLFFIIPLTFSLLPSPAHAQINSLCFTREECAAAPYNGRPSESEAPECASEQGRKFYCYAPEPVICPPGVQTENCAVKLAVSIGSQKIEGLGGYVAAVYTYLLSIAGILAGIMITVGGFQWLIAAGDAGKIKAAKEKIVNALVGILIAAGSYVILQTINPALVGLSLPPVKLTRRSLSEPVCCKSLDNLYRSSFEDCDKTKQEQQVEYVFCSAKITTSPVRCADATKGCGEAYQEVFRDQNGKDTVVDCVGGRCPAGSVCQILDTTTKTPIKGCRPVSGVGSSAECPDLSTFNQQCYGSPQCVNGRWTCPQGGSGQSGGPKQ